MGIDQLSEGEGDRKTGVLGHIIETVEKVAGKGPSDSDADAAKGQKSGNKPMFLSEALTDRDPTSNKAGSSGAPETGVTRGTSSVIFSFGDPALHHGLPSYCSVLKPHKPPAHHHHHSAAHLHGETAAHGDSQVGTDAQIRMVAVKPGSFLKISSLSTFGIQPNALSSSAGAGQYINSYSIRVDAKVPLY